MKKWFFLWFIAIGTSSSWAQESNCKELNTESIQNLQLEQFLSVTNSEDDIELFEKFNDNVVRLEKTRKRRRSDYSFLKAIFYKTHNTLLKDYDRIATMDQTLTDGTFGCLTGTAVYALILEHFGYEYRIIELPNHVFIHLTVDGNSYVYESTLPMNGFRRTTVEMEKLLKQPWVNHRRISELSVVGDWFDEKITLPGHYSIINIEQLAGLQYFNESVKSYLQKDYVSAMENVLKAYDLYPSEKNEKLMQLIINKILKYDLIKEEVRNQYLEKYVRMVKHQKISQTK